MKELNHLSPASQRHMATLQNKSDELLTQLSRAILDLDHRIGVLQLPPMASREWYELLQRKLCPQMGKHPYLIAAVLGGTNIGKSVIFNHLVGERISSPSPIAAGTKHPTAVLAPQLREQLDLEKVFINFEIRPWENAEQPLQNDDRDLLFYREVASAPPNLILLDTPDVDSVAEMNWRRATGLRQAADVLITVLTQQKYNDAAIKTFFRTAAEEGKMVIVIFNQCLLPDDEEYWPLWLQTFCQETGVSPALVYVAPNNRQAAESNRLPFYERPWPAGTQEWSAEDLARPHNLLHDLSKFKFDEIKTRALSGALNQVLDPTHGIPAWLREIEQRSGSFADALKLLSAERLAEVDRWPKLPISVLIQSVREWWGQQRSGWTANVHGFYRRVGEVISYPVKQLWGKKSSAEDPIEIYRQQEWDVILDVLERCFQRLENIRDLGNPLLKAEIDEILAGVSRAHVISELRSAHQQLDLAAEVRDLVQQQLSNFKEESPEQFRVLRGIDTAAAVARPAISVALFATGAGPIGDALLPVAVNSVAGSLIHAGGEAVGGAVVTVVGDQVLGESAGKGAGLLEARIRKFDASFAKLRGEWLALNISQLVLRGLRQELVDASEVKSSPEFKEVFRLTRELRASLQLQ